MAAKKGVATRKARNDSQATCYIQLGIAKQSPTQTASWKWYVDLFYETATRRKKLETEINDGSLCSPATHEHQSARYHECIAYWKQTAMRWLSGRDYLKRKRERKREKEDFCGSKNLLIDSNGGAFSAAVSHPNHVQILCSSTVRGNIAIRIVAVPIGRIEAEVPTCRGGFPISIIELPQT